MAFAIGIRASDAAGAPLRDLWAEFTRLEETPSMIALNYPPHVTLAVYDSIPVEQLRDALRCELGTLPPFRLTFVKLAFFECPQLVFWAAPDPSEPLSRAHAAIHRRLDPMLCRAHYRPRAWTPHCTLATNVGVTNKPKAIARAAEGIEPFDVVFDQADCVEFYPVRIIDQCTLVERS
jgi:2'-5' RNA ligase